jgi:hypothetical protein
VSVGVLADVLSLLNTTMVSVGVPVDVLSLFNATMGV